MDRRGSIRLSIDSRLENVFLVGLAVRSVCRYLGLGESEGGRLETSVVEAVNNAIEHAYRGQPGQEVAVEIHLSTDRLTFRISDRGRCLEERDLKPRLEFDPRSRESVPEGGMGLYIIRQAMDEITLLSEDGLNVLTLVRFLGPGRRKEAGPSGL